MSSSDIVTGFHSIEIALDDGENQVLETVTVDVRDAPPLEEPEGEEDEEEDAPSNDESSTSEGETSETTATTA